MMKEALEQLDDKHYTMHFPTPTKVKISCGQEQYKTLHGSYLAVIPLHCQLKAPEFTITNMNEHIKGHVVKIMEMPLYDESRPQDHPSIVLDSINLENLHSANKKISIQAPVKLNKVADQSLYHTTIPLYVVLLLALALSIAFAIYRLRKNYRLKQNEAVITPRAANPSEIRVDLRNIAATIPRNVRE